MKPIHPFTWILSAALFCGCLAAQTVITNEVVAVRLTLKCDKCGGEMVSTGTVLTSYPARYPHACNKCKTNTVIIQGYSYPSIDFITK